MRNESKEKNIIIGVLCFAIIGMSIGFAALSSALNINGTAKVQANDWDVHFVNVANENTVGAPNVLNKPTIDGLSTTVNYEVTLTQPGDKYSFTVDVVNDGSIDAKLSSFVIGGVSTEQDVYVNYTVTGMTESQVLAAGDTETITVTIEYDPNVTAAQLPTENQTLNLSATLNFVQK